MVGLASLFFDAMLSLPSFLADFLRFTSYRLTLNTSLRTNRDNFLRGAPMKGEETEFFAGDFSYYNKDTFRHH
jgi:hypothetical protein